MNPHPPIDPALERLTVRRCLAGMATQGVWWAGYVLLPVVPAESPAAGAALLYCFPLFFWTTMIPIQLEREKSLDERPERLN